MNDKITSLIAQVSAIYPELRLGQLLTIAAKNANWQQSDIFYCPDDRLERGLTVMVNNYNKHNDGYYCKQYLVDSAKSTA